MKFLLSKEQWYALRDDRTNRIIKKNLGDDYSVGVIIDPKISESYALQCMAVLTCNNLARWCRKIIIDMPDCNQTISSVFDGNLKNHIQKNMSEIDPHGDFTFQKIDEEKCSLLLCIGDPKNDLTKPFFWIDGSGWLAGYGYCTNSGIEQRSEKNPIGPAFASCLASAFLFSQAINTQDITKFSNYYSLFDYKQNSNHTVLQNPNIPSTIDIGKICQVGCGAVGSSFDYLLALTSYNGDIQLIDFDVVKYENCSSSFAFTAYDAQENKVETCSKFLQKRNFNVNTHCKSYNDFTNESNFEHYNPDLILCFANEDDVWTRIQNIIPCIVLHAATTESWAVTFGRHIPIKEWCIVCAFYHLIDAKFVGQCSTGVIEDSNKNTIVGNLPFLAPCAATFVLAEIIRLNMNIIEKSNYVHFSFRNPFSISENHRKKMNECMCTTQPSNIFKQLRNNTKFFNI